MAILAEKLAEDNSVIHLMELMDPKHYRTVELSRRVGFDKITVGLCVVRVDWDVLSVIETSEDGLNKTLRMYSCRDEDKKLAICSDEPREKWYSQIHIQLASKAFTMKKCNLPGCRDICLFEICIPPIEGHECLGNISNLTCEQEQFHVQHMMDVLENYGIFVDREYAVLKKVELNVNLFITGHNMNFYDAVELLRPHRHKIRNFEFSDFAEEDGDSNYYLHLDDYKYEALNLTKIRKTSFNSVGRSLTIKVYDKSAETIKKSRGFIEWMQPLTRIEFFLKEQNEILYYFGRKTNLFEMTQEDLVEAFRRLVYKFICVPVKEYYREIYRVFEKYFENVDISEYAWRRRLVADLDGAVKSLDEVVLLPEDILKGFVKLIPNYSRNTKRTRILESLKNEFKNATCIRVTKEWEVDELLVWLCECGDEEPQTICYATSRDEQEDYDE